MIDIKPSPDPVPLDKPKPAAFMSVEGLGSCLIVLGLIMNGLVHTIGFIIDLLIHILRALGVYS